MASNRKRGPRKDTPTSRRKTAAAMEKREQFWAKLLKHERKDEPTVPDPDIRSLVTKHGIPTGETDFTFVYYTRGYVMSDGSYHAFIRRDCEDNWTAIEPSEDE